ncbi:MAG: (d)CMP kinase [Acutalibacteraceae bacterium]|nr:(d)CMP kinase [Acutalibacteraceae bacterium]
MISIAIDGPAGAGKSTIAKGVAKKIGYIYVDTGAIYRTLAYYMISNGISAEETEKIVDNLGNAKVEIKYIDGVQCVFLNGEDVSGKIRTPQISMAASTVSAIPEVRAHLLSIQRDLAEKNNVIMDGRDIGTVVLPNATVKIFLTACVECRAERRYKEMVEKGMDANLEEVIEDIKVRDYNDSHRDVAPLKPAEDSTVIDTSWQTLEQSVAQIENFIIERLK